MAQKTKKDETKFKVIPEAITLCVKCGVALAKDLRKKYFSATAVGSSLERKLKPVEINKGLKKEDLESTELLHVKKEVNWCSNCQRKVNLTKFRCRYSKLFYANHRYSYWHDCSYIYKAAGREAISREDQVVKAAKIVKF
ncbi:zinc finger A20 and AN1 domain-containing stress-associated protein 5-like [Olea europaea var. sylvestris]|uniref:zinc finger A20 and AN1 domain-containing stress-associated protein 5-like n=1 Tax=Olea europaea var. sylvestris TaxID=158386 RepID=UPI000C1CED86|nr:zinc finger A20 and AN1 domain-containing stress-associated protein 5-like [Olea europaea var. sylvestris]